MERSEFLKYFGTGLLVCTGCSLVSCGNNDDPTPSGVDFTLDLTLPENSSLQSAGGSVSKDGVIVDRISSNEFTALSRACTHEGTNVNYRSTQQDFLCPNHGSVFDKNGSVKTGPATKVLFKYNTELTGNSLRVFS
ncbi:MAG: Rieske 2Fe-2S domain-containing protein [Bacteroidia bacterium]|nr:Rieske 2Fe-2S domain-containing protein [Bacteroidia bacterium]